MSSLRLFLGLLKMANHAAEDVGLSNLTNSDREVLLMLWKLSAEGEQVFKASYEDLFEEASHNGDAISKSQFYKSIKSLEKINLLSRVGGPRSQTYSLAGKFSPN